MNLITALSLCERYRVCMVDHSPDPGQTPAKERLGATHSGGNARMCTATEADSYAPRIHFGETNQREQFTRLLGHGGWLSSKVYHDNTDTDWIGDTLGISPWKGEIYARDIYSVNLRSMKLWRSLRERFGNLFDNVHCADGVIRIYESLEDLRQAVKRHGDLGVLSRVFSQEELAEAHPATRTAVANRLLAGGIAVDGFTLQVHDFVRNLVAYLTQEGVEFRWSQAARSLLRDELGRICSVEVDSGGGSVEAISADHYVISPGHVTAWLQHHFSGAAAIRGVYGVWLDVPNIYGQAHSMKYRRGFTGLEDTNITILSGNSDRGSLLLGSGYCFVGEGPFDRRADDFRFMAKQIAVLAQALFPEAYAVRDPVDLESPLCCVRPWTPSGLGVFSRMPTSRGGTAILTGGNNTGGFTQAPVIAEAVAATLGGEHHDLALKFSEMRAMGRWV